MKEATFSEPPTAGGAVRGFVEVYAAPAVGWRRHVSKRQSITPVAPVTRSPPRNRLSRVNGSPLGCRAGSGFWVERPSSRVIRSRAFAAASATASGDPGW